MAIDRLGALFSRRDVSTGFYEGRASPLWQQAEGNASLRERYKRFLGSALQFLPTEQQEAIRLYYLQGERIPAIASRLGVSRSTVSRRLRAGADTLRRLARLCIDAGFLPP